MANSLPEPVSASPLRLNSNQAPALASTITAAAARVTRRRKRANFAPFPLWRASVMTRVSKPNSISIGASSFAFAPERSNRSTSLSFTALPPLQPRQLRFHFLPGAGGADLDCSRAQGGDLMDFFDRAALQVK